MDDKRTKDEKFERIYESYVDDVYRASFHLTMNADLAQEMTQQAFVNFYERMDDLDVEYAKAYIIRSARNLSYNYYRDTKREWTPDEESEEVRKTEPITEGVEEQYFEEIQKDMKGQLTEEILSVLKEKHGTWYEVIYMVFFLDMKHDEIAERLGITKEVLYSRLHRAKIWIRKNYKDEFENIMKNG